MRIAIVLRIKTVKKIVNLPIKIKHFLIKSKLLEHFIDIAIPRKAIPGNSKLFVILHFPLLQS